jgi:hypothetical protein
VLDRRERFGARLLRRPVANHTSPALVSRSQTTGALVGGRSTVRTGRGCQPVHPRAGRMLTSVLGRLRLFRYIDESLPSHGEPGGRKRDVLREVGEANDLAGCA